MAAATTPGCRRQAGFTLLEAMVAMAIVAMVVLSFLGIRTTALVDATRARNWRLAREIAEERLSEVQAGAFETPPRSGEELPLEKYPGFSLKFVIGETAIGQLETELADSAAAEDETAADRLAWQRNREQFRRASSKGLSAIDFQEQQLAAEEARRREEKPPAETEFEEIAVVVYFPKLDATEPDQRETLLIRARLSTLALSGRTPEQAAALAAAQGGAGQSGGANSPLGPGAAGAGAK
jgi:type II secretion system protein I